MKESERPLRSRLLSASQRGELLEFCLKHGNESRLPAELTELHEKGVIDLVSEVLGVEVAANTKRFLQCRLIGRVLESLSAGVEGVLEALVSSGTLCGPGVAEGVEAFCRGDRVRLRAVLESVEADPSTFGVLIPGLLALLSIGRPRDAAKVALRLAGTKCDEAVLGVVNAVARMKWPTDAAVRPQFQKLLLQIAKAEQRSVVAHACAASAVALAGKRKLKSGEAVLVIEAVMEANPSHAVEISARLVAFSWSSLPAASKRSCLGRLVAIEVPNADVLGLVDLCIAELIQHGQVTQALGVLANIVAKGVECEGLEQTQFALTRSPRVASSLVTRWFLRAEASLCDALAGLLDLSRRDDDLSLVVEEAAVDGAEAELLWFLARKAVGYFFHHPRVACSFLVSLICLAEASDERDQIAELMFDPLLVNYSGDAADCLKELAANLSGKDKAAVRRSLRHGAKYVEVLRGVGEIRALHPSASQTREFLKQQAVSMAKAYGEAERRSPLMSIMSKQVILYGRKVVYQSRLPSGEMARSVSAMGSFSTSMEVPRMDVVDPMGLEIMLRTFRRERIRA